MKDALSPARSNAVDVIRVGAMVGVLNLHTVLNFTQRPDFFLTKIWWALEPVVALSKPAVIIFFILSGYLILTKPRSIREMLTKTGRRLVIPLVFFELLNLLMDWRQSRLGQLELGSGSGLMNFEINRLTEQISSPLWFLVVLVFLYLLTPLFQLLFENEDRRKLARYITGLFFLLPIVIILVNPLLTDGKELYNAFTHWLAFVGFYLYGGLVRKNWLKWQDKRRNGWLLGGSLLVVIAAQLLYGYLGRMAEAPVGLVWLESVVARLAEMGVGVSIFNLLLSVDWLGRIFRTELTKSKWRQITKFLAGVSFGVYLWHPLVIHVLYASGFTFDELGLSPVLFTGLNWTMVLASSVLLSWLVGKIPYLRKVVGG